MPCLVKRFSQYAPQLTVLLYRGLLALLLCTCRWRVNGLSSLLTAAKSGQCALILWHNKLMLAAPLLCRCAAELDYIAVVSHSHDGRLIAQVATSYRQCHALFVSSKGRAAALRAIIRILQHGKQVVVMTPDGPRGPCRHVKPGIALAALRTGAAIVPMTWRASRSWQLATWDGMMLPKPFAVIEVTFGPQRSFRDDTPLGKVISDLQAMLEA